MPDRIQNAADFIGKKLKRSPDVGMITGTGLGNLTEKMHIDFRIPYHEIPHFPISTTDSHKGTLVSGRFAGRSVMAMEGRFHLYEGYTPYEITFPVRIMSKLGVKYLLISSAAGGLNHDYKEGDLMLVTDHINMTGANPLIGPNMSEFGPRFPDMSKVYDHELMDLAVRKAMNKGISLRQGVYIGVAGPSLETPSETRFYKMIGADAIGMSTVHEVIAAVHCGLKIIAIVVITNINLPENMKRVAIEDIIARADSASHKLSLLWEDIIGDLHE